MSDAAREVRLTEAQDRYIGKINLPDSLVAIIGNPPRRSFQLTSVQKYDFVSILGGQLQQHGFDSNYKPTPDGSMVESIIDVLTNAPE